MSSGENGVKTAFYGRELELDILRGYITQGKSVYISGIRRIGKTSLMREVKNVLESNNQCFFYDFGGNTSPADWIRELNEENEGTINKLLKNIDEAITKYGVKKDLPPLSMLIKGSDWKEMGNNLFKKLHNSCPDGEKIVIFIDELAIMIQSMQKKQFERKKEIEVSPYVKDQDEVEEFINWFASIQRKFGDKISFVMANSVSLDRLLKLLNLGNALKNFEPFPLRAWKRETAKGFIAAKASENAIEISDEAAEEMLKMLGDTHIPQYIDSSFNDVRYWLRMENKTSCQIGDLQDIFRKQMLHGWMRITRDTTQKSLKDSMLEHEYFLARRILSKLAHKEDKLITIAEVRGIIFEKEATAMKDKISEESIENVLAVLEEEEGCIIKKEGEDIYRFRSPFMYDMWRNIRGH